MESSVGSTEWEGIDGDVPDLASVDGLSGSEEWTVESTLHEGIASVYPDVLVITPSIDETGKLVLGVCLQIVGLITEINVAGDWWGHYWFYFINY